MSDIFEALLISFQGSRALIRDAAGEEHQCKLRQVGRDTVTGDVVEVEIIQDEPVILRRIERSSEFFRTDMRGQRKMIAANLNCLAVVVAPEPEPHLGLIDRYLVAAELCGIPAALIVNKVDLGSSEIIDEIKRLYPLVNYQVIEVSAHHSENMEELVSWAKGKHLAFLGQSGVGKSSLINTLVGIDSAAVGDLSHKRAKGRHTTTSSYIYEMPFGGWIMDSPGIRDFENSQWKTDEVIRGFPEIYEASLNCKFRNCSHGADTGCAVIEQLSQGKLEISRMQSYRAIMANI